MYKKLSKTKGAVDEFQVDSIKKVLSKLQTIIDYPAKDNVFKIKKNEKIIDIVQRILYFNQLNQSGQGLKIWTPNQILSRLPISLAQLKAGKRKNSKTKLGNYCILCIDPKNLLKISIKLWLILFKNGNNLYKHWK